MWRTGCGLRGAFLLLNGWKLKKIHTLQSLLDEAATFGETLQAFRPLCERISAFYMAERYPTLGSVELQAGDVQQELSEARLLIRKLFPDERLE